MTSEVPSAQTILFWTLITSLTTVITYYLYHTCRRVEKIPAEWKPVGFVDKIYMYPLKSGHRKEVTEAECTMRGLQHIHSQENLYRLRDREFLVYKQDDNEFRTARTYPQMFKIEISVHDETQIAVNAPNMRTLYVRIPNKDGEKKRVKFWKQENLTLIDCGDGAAKWFSKYILGEDTGLRLGYYCENIKREPSKSWKQDLKYYPHLRNSSFGRLNDLSSIHLINQKSIDDLRQKMEDPSDQVSALNFRPNIVIDGVDLEAFEEDNWDFLKIGDNVICRNVRDCTRCMMTTLDPNTCVRNKSREPLKTLEKYRMSNGPEKAPSMGIHLEVLEPGILKVGDHIYINIPK